ncbi:hypothetical protein CAC42_7270 [Sphaceloma murrayae]|uniref:Amidase domain-containing protein n=1 Tax=Sphaceloma murrayae TaxID=2082308 RepID=A0A2K1QQ48_9PEZI|nr:hypothetical protein CAC42_7270 [Sphaceloma murrayae]
MPTPVSIVDANASQLQAALVAGHINSVELTAKHLLRIASYDRRGPHLNAIPLINPDVFDEAQASDDRRAAGSTHGPLDGIPCTIKDSYKMRGMTVASGSPAFANLRANEDAFTVAKIREAGCVIMGRTNMPPMAAGGMQRGVYGRAESPYNEEYLTAAFASGSSNGSATATASSFGVFGMGEETISSGRSPASNNGLVAYTPSRGLVSIRGNWPLFPTCDTVVPHTRSVEDMFSLLDVIVGADDVTTGDFWRDQPFVKLPDPRSIKPKTYHELADTKALSGKRIGVPRMYIGGHDPKAIPVHTRQSVIELWENARRVLESCGASVEEVDFPVVTNFEDGEATGESGSAPVHRNDIDMCQLMAFAWDDFLRNNGDASCATTLASIDSATIFPRPPGALKDRYDSMDPLARHKDVVAHVSGGRIPTFDIPGLGAALQSLEDRRKSDYEDWMAKNNLDMVVWPCNGDVGLADADVNPKSAELAWRNGTLYSNGNCAIRQLGIPTFSVPMGIMKDTRMPVNLTFATKAYHDNDILKYGYAFEQASRLRQPPGRTPALPSDTIIVDEKLASIKGTPPLLSVSGSASGKGAERALRLHGSVSREDLATLEIFVDGKKVEDVQLGDGTWTTEVTGVSEWKGRLEERGTPSPELSLVLVLARGSNGRSTGRLLFV